MSGILKAIIGTVAFLDIVFVGVVGTLILTLTEFYDMDNCLLSRKEFIRCVFQWELFVWENSEDYVNIAGRIILVSIATILTFPFNFACLFIMSLLELARVVIWAFLKCFGKRIE